MTKELHREIMKRSRLRNNLLRTKSQEDRLKYNKQRNFCKLLRTAKKLYFTNFDIKKVDNRSFWKTVSPNIFSTKCSKGDKIALNENDMCLMTANYVKFFMTTPKLSLNFKFQVYPKIFQT